MLLKYISYAHSIDHNPVLISGLIAVLTDKKDLSMGMHPLLNTLNKIISVIHQKNFSEH